MFFTNAAEYESTITVAVSEETLQGAYSYLADKMEHDGAVRNAVSVCSSGAARQRKRAWLSCPPAVRAGAGGG